MRVMTVFFTTATLYSIFYLTCLLLMPSWNSGIKSIVGLFALALALFATGGQKVQAKHAALSGIIAVAVGFLVPLFYLLIMLSSQGASGPTIFNLPLYFFVPIVLSTGCMAFLLSEAQAKKEANNREH